MNRQPLKDPLFVLVLTIAGTLVSAVFMLMQMELANLRADLGTLHTDLVNVNARVDAVMIAAKSAGIDVETQSLPQQP